MFFDDAQAFTAAQSQPLSSLVPDDHIMFGSDWPATRHIYAADNVERTNALAQFPKLRERIRRSGPR